ncbi:hypothetical protein PRIPAC_71358 [Pristionchus pacificus]|uniref:G protein-coupled receptor n=1 Tax=Pristionchus pacificus TaxID=54126 RepID=A0A2A6B5F4_PRIPA|nr:hypothetical protein PRIPAC_71358 [Pristionchus pacificus]|eukprot:PDM61107.1 G protein-coupled receptor [Pristionchus pacificus]
MDNSRIRLATKIIHVVSLFGFSTNILAIFSIVKTPRLHSTFGLLCVILAANNSFVLAINSMYLMPVTGIFAMGTILSRIVGMVSKNVELKQDYCHCSPVGLASWVVGVRFHLLISLNRFVAIAFPLKSKRIITARSTSFAIGLMLFLSLAQCAPLLLLDDLWFCYDHKKMLWLYSPNESGRFYKTNINDQFISIEFGCLLLVDSITIAYLRFGRSNTLVGNLKKRAIEIRLFKQAFSQSVPLFVAFLLFAFVTPHLSNDFDKFLSETLMWHLAHGIDGLILDLFHTRLSLFKK